jgi:pantetheine-phosphate adenylyltransferase
VEENVRTALYPGSFDPVTNGHMDIIARASRLFDALFVGVYANPNKDVLFSLEERVEMLSTAVKRWPNVQIRSFANLTVECAHELGAQVLVRGLRAVTDFEYEFQLAAMYQQLRPNLEVVCLMTSVQYSFLSASLVKEVAKLGGNVDAFVPAAVAARLREIQTA